MFRRLDGIVREGAILATNTSYLDVDAIAAVTRRPSHVLGLHFFSPANVMRLLEVVRGAATAPEVLATAMATAKRIGKVAVVARVCHGFIGNRMLEPRQRQAERLVLEGARPQDVDRVLRDFGMPMGPFQMADLAGLDLGWDEASSSGGTLREMLCERGRRGQKNGRGYYDYDDERNRTASGEVEALIRDFAVRSGITQRAIPDDEIRERLLYPMVDEGARILAEGIAQRASDIDVVWVNGYGWPAATGGPMFWGGRDRTGDRGGWAAPSWRGYRRLERAGRARRERAQSDELTSAGASSSGDLVWSGADIPTILNCSRGDTGTAGRWPPWASAPATSASGSTMQPEREDGAAVR